MHRPRIGCSGWEYKHWRGDFYATSIPRTKWFEQYAQIFDTVEINNTFYRLPQASMIANWKEQVPESFRFSIKATQRITHIKRLKNCSEETRYLLDTASLLGDRLGVVLFQLPPNSKKDLERLREFLDCLPEPIRCAFEFRHESWFEDDTFAALQAKNCALVVSDTDEKPLDEIIVTADWGYLRLRKTSYEAKDLKEWMKRVQNQTWSDAFIFFKHEDEGVGPKLAAKFLKLG